MTAIALTRWKIIGLLLVVAGSAGWLGFIAGERHRDAQLAQQRRDQSSIHLLYLRRLEEALHLSDDQRARIRPALDAAAERTRRLGAQTAADAARIREDMRAAILPVLTAEQRARYEKFEADREARHNRVRGNVREYLDRRSDSPNSTRP